MYTVPELQERFNRPKQPKLPGEEYQERTKAFWALVKPEVSWWNTEFGSAVGSTLFWQLAETQWLWDVTVKGWEPTQLAMDQLHWEASLMNELGGLDGYWRGDQPVVVVPVTWFEDVPPDEMDKTWIRDTSVDAEGNCPF